VGCRRFDSAIGGLGGCPFAQDVLVGNITDGEAIGCSKKWWRRVADAQADYELLRVAAEIGDKFSGPKM